ncbi:hypothetical protein GGP91_002537, partial [Salinibacter ruber]|nr:hypothetical protein [Salinibacter ruber]MCS4056482.1 hypothetical protein [Salinibacter ruber]MCS4060748.1 hypothetical protein [Salinibacter ruber]MCS4102639.1 hypothetical protein [Salinibacter ruber]MCS4162092.1 hypothetical protein [Salinibacter ruber]
MPLTVPLLPLGLRFAVSVLTQVRVSVPS